MGTRIGMLKIPVLNLVLCLVLYTCFAFYCISAVLRDRCWFCCSVLSATVINEHYYYYYYYYCLCDPRYLLQTCVKTITVRFHYLHSATRWIIHYSRIAWYCYSLMCPVRGAVLMIKAENDWRDGRPQVAMQPNCHLYQNVFDRKGCVVSLRRDLCFCWQLMNVDMSWYCMQGDVSHDDETRWHSLTYLCSCSISVTSASEVH